jgi:regulator of protease activity HflC (stomatin/prohibitin superfamily)
MSETPLPAPSPAGESSDPSRASESIPRQGAADAAPEQPSRWRKLMRWYFRRQAALGWYGFCMSVIMLLLWPYSVITIESGHVGVLYHRFQGGTVLDRIYPEGTHLVFPWNTMHVFDVRIHEEFNTFTVLSRNGLLLDVDVSVLYHPIAEKTPLLMVSVGKNYREKLVLPMLLASVRNVVGQYGYADFYSDLSGQIQDDIHVNIIESMGRNPVSIDSILIRAVRLPDRLNQAINEKLVAEQSVLREQFRVMEAQERYKVRLVDAEAVRVAQEIVNQNMTENFLRWQGIEATRELAQSPNSKFVVIGGGKDGLPLILNPDVPGSAVMPSAPAASTAPVQTSRQEALVLPDQNKGFMDRIGQETLERVEKQLQGLLTSSAPKTSVKQNGEQ